MDRLLREGNPPEGQLASPKPQYKKPGVDEYEAVEGQHGAPFAILKDASGNVVSPATDAKLEQVKTELELVKSELEAIKANQLSGNIATTQGVSPIEIEPGATVVIATIKSDDFSKFNISLNGAPGSVFGEGDLLYEATHEAGNYSVTKLVHKDRRIETETVGGANWRISQDETLRGVESRFKFRNNDSSQVVTLRTWQIRRF